MKLRISFLAFLTLLVFNTTAQFITNNGISITSTAALVTNGDWTNDAGTIIRNNGSITTNASFINNGTLDATSTGGFVLKFPSDTNFQPGGSSFGFLTMDNTGAALVTGTISIRDSLKLRNGLIKLLVPTDTVSIRSGGVLLQSGLNSYVDGVFARAGTGNLVFPLGRDGYYLPLTLHKVQAQKITASVVPEPGGITPGPGVSALIGYPYAWKVEEKVAADTAAYVEVNYPNTLPFVANAIVVRQIPGSKYESMGARTIINAGGRVTVRSYSRRLKGLFSVAQGFPQNLKTDSLALVAFFNSTGGATWTSRTNWLAGAVGTWFGVTLSGQSITALSLPTNNVAGPVPEPMVDIVGLQTVNLAGNKITAIPDFTSNAQITALNVSNNRLTFATLEPNAPVPGINYANQADLGTVIDTLLAVGSPYQFSVNAGGNNSQYLWKRNGTVLSGATAPIYSLAALSRSNMGTYISEVTNTSLPGLTLKSAAHTALAHATIAGKLLRDPALPATKGKVTLFKITTAAYDTIASVDILNDGSYTFPKVILDDYQLLGFADTLTHIRALPTYYPKTIFWEEADTIFLTGNVANLDIDSEFEPGPPAGLGSINGYLEEDDGTGRMKKKQKAKRVSGAGVSARRVENTGRSKEEILTLVAYVFTNENGEFTLPDLPTGEYRLNIQYPGYPMDETSFITVPIGVAFKSQVSVQANVENGKINVRKIIITGMGEADDYEVNVFPNPAVDFIRLQFATESKGRAVRLTDITGKSVASNPAAEKEVMVDVKTTPKGMYFLSIKENETTVKTLKVIIE